MPEALGVLQKIGFAFALAYVFIRFSLISEVVFFKLGLRAYLPYLTAPLALLAMVFSGGLRRIVQFRPGIYLLCFFGWLLLAAPFSFWKGGTVEQLGTSFSADFSVFFMVAGLTVTWRQWRAMLAAVAVACVFQMILLTAFGAYYDGRYSMTFGTLMNPNDLATHVLLILPLFAGLMLLSSRFSPWKVIGVITIPAVIYVVLLTGSRGGFLTLAVMTTAWLARAPIYQKLTAVILLIVSIPLITSVVPSTSLRRYTGMLTDTAAEAKTRQEYLDQTIATGSTQARLDLLVNSVDATLRNPLFGVGPGMFAAEQAEIAKATGKRTAWQVTHNSYTEASSEAGIPAFLFFLASVLGSLMLLYSIWGRFRGRPEFHYLSIAAGSLLLGGISLAVSMMFSAIAYSYYVPWLVGMATSLAAIAQRQESTPAASPIR